MIGQEDLRGRWSSIVATDGWDDVPIERVIARAIEGIAWGLLDETMDTSDREPSVEAYEAAVATGRRCLAAHDAERDALAVRVEAVERLADVVRRLQQSDPDTGDRDVSFFALMEALHPDDFDLVLERREHGTGGGNRG